MKVKNKGNGSLTRSHLNNNDMDNYITAEKFSFWKEFRIGLVISAVCLAASIYGFIVGTYGLAALNAFVVILNVIIIYKNLPPKWARNAFVVILNVIIIYKNLPPKWARKEMKGMKGGYSNRDFIDHLAEDLHSEVGIKIYDDK